MSATSTDDAAENELFVVEGASAANAVKVACDKTTQHVLGLQGKPLNVERASKSQIAKNDRIADIVDAVGGGRDEQFHLDSVVPERVLLLTDADADGVHARALYLLVFDAVMPELIEAGRLWSARPPLFSITVPGMAEELYAYSPPHRERVVAELNKRGHHDYSIEYYKSIAGLDADQLWATCLNPKSRQARQLTRQDAEKARTVLAKVRSTLG